MSFYTSPCPQCGATVRLPYDPSKSARKVLCADCFAAMRQPAEVTVPWPDREIVILKVPPKRRKTE